MRQWRSRDGRGLPAYRASCTSSARTPIVSARRRPAERHRSVAQNRASCLARPGRLPTAQAARPVPDRACCGELSLSPPRATWIPRPGCSAASEPTDAYWPVAAGKLQTGWQVVTADDTTMRSSNCSRTTPRGQLIAPALRGKRVSTKSLAKTLARHLRSGNHV